MRHPALLFVVGLAIGSLITFALFTSPQRETSGYLRPSSTGDHQATAVASPVARSDPEKRRVLLGNIKTVPFQELYGVLTNCSPAERAQLAQQLAELPAGKETKIKINKFFSAWSHLDPSAAMVSAMALKAGDARSTAMNAVIAGSDGASGASLAAMIDHLTPEILPATDKMKFLNRALTKWSEVDPVAAANFLDASPSATKGLLAARVSVAGNWAESDPEAALAWVQAHTPAEETNTVMSGVINGWWRADPRAAEAYVASHLDTLGPQTIMTMTRQLFNQDPQQAKDWVAGLVRPEVRRSASYFIATQLAASDPKAAGDWATSLPREVRRAAIDGVINAWVRRDPQEAGQWINTLTGTPRDDAINAFSSAVAPRDPATALTWAASVSDEKMREAAMDRIAEGWIRRNTTAATAWIQSSGLPDAEKARLLALSPRSH